MYCFLTCNICHPYFCFSVMSSVWLLLRFFSLSLDLIIMYLDVTFFVFQILLSLESRFMGKDADRWVELVMGAYGYFLHIASVLSMK